MPFRARRHRGSCHLSRPSRARTAVQRQAHQDQTLLRGLWGGNWPVAAAIAAGLFLVLTLPQNSTVLADQVIAGHVRSMAMFAKRVAARSG
jgi:hypothetical protein